MFQVAAKILIRLGGYGALLLLFSFGCEGEKDDPDIVDRADLKSPGALDIVDLGAGKVQLRWFTANQEDDFEGYNIYGASGTATELGVTEGSPMQLLDNSGEPKETTKEILANFTYRSDNANALPGVADNAEGVYEQGEKKFSAFPYHKVRTATKEPNLPTCKPNINSQKGICVGLGTAKEETDASSINSNGVLIYDFPEILTIGHSYCFFIFSVQDEGSEISQSSTNVACIIPRYQVAGNFTYTVANASSEYFLFDIRALRVECTTSCPEALAISSDGTSELASGQTNETNPLQFENYGASSIINLVSGQKTVVRWMGKFIGGFQDPLFVSSVAQAPSLVYDSNNIKHGGGYVPQFQSIPLAQYDMFAVAVNDPTSTATETQDFYYDWIWIESIDTGGKVAVQARLASNKNVSRR